MHFESVVEFGSLAAAFMGANLTSHFDANNASIRAERGALLEYLDFTSNTPPLANKNLQFQVKEYLQSVLEEEWLFLEEERTSAHTDLLFQNIFKQTIAIAPALEGTQPGRELAKILDAWYQARSSRVSFRWHQIEYLRWQVLFMVAFLLQIAVAAPHLVESKRTMSLAIGITTALIIAVITPLALSVDHYSGTISVSKVPLEEVYQILSSQFSDDR
jgi:hypothetical protein